MGATLDALHRLQSIDKQLRTIRDRIESKRRVVQVRRRKTAAIQRQLTDAHQRIKDAQAEADRLELDRIARENDIGRLRETLNQVKTNKEYAAVLTELNTDKADMAKFEDAALAALTRVDDFKAEETTHTQSLEQQESRVAEVERTAQATEDQFGGQVTNLEAQRSEACLDIPGDVLGIFERACEAHEGEAMAIVQQIHPKRTEYICGGCNMSITLETVNSLQSRDTILPCQTCSRILYLDQPTGAAV